MPANVTPTPFSTSKWLLVSNDGVVQNEYGIAPTTTSTPITSVNQTGEALFGRPYVLKTVYSAQPQLVQTINVSNLAGTQMTLTRTSTYYTVVLVNVTQYHTVVPTNATVWSSLNTSSSILFGPSSDIVSYKVSLVADTVV